MAAIAIQSASIAEQHLFTCLSCSVAFPSAEDQREHYKSDHHRYNMKRRVAALPPVSAAVFNQKVLERRAEVAVTLAPKDLSCKGCSKVYTTENAYKSHLNSRKHKENALKVANQREASTSSSSSDIQRSPSLPSKSASLEASVLEDGPSSSKPASALTDDVTEHEINKFIDDRIAVARDQLSPNRCLFCPQESPDLDANLTHMSSAHSFFIPEAEYLVDINGLITYLGEKIAVGNICIYCNSKSRQFRSLEAVKRHMLDKRHCMMAYGTEDDRLELSDFYDFSSSYPDYENRKKGNGKKPIKVKEEQSGEGEWEDVNSEGEDADEIVDEDSQPPESDEEDDDSFPNNQLSYGDSEFELVLPSGVRIGHRTMRRYYAQSFVQSSRSAEQDPNSGAAIVRRLLADKNSALVPRKGGFGAFGVGTDVVEARNRGEAREAGRHVREFRDQRRREEFKTRVGFNNNHQKHYRDPLLQ